MLEHCEGSGLQLIHLAAPSAFNENLLGFVTALIRVRHQHRFERILFFGFTFRWT